MSEDKKILCYICCIYIKNGRPFVKSMMPVSEKIHSHIWPARWQYFRVLEWERRFVLSAKKAGVILASSSSQKSEEFLNKEDKDKNLLFIVHLVVHK